MAPTLIVLALLALGVGIVAWATRHKPLHPPAPGREEDTAWNDPLTPAGGATPTDPFAAAASHDPEPRP